MSKAVATVALVLSVAWAVYGFRESHRSGDLDRGTLLVILACVVAVLALGYLAVGSGYTTGTCGSGPTSYDC